MAEASIAFRNKDMTGTIKIYVNTLEAAAELVAKFRNASHLVDVINQRDEVVWRWENGSPDWELGHVQPMKVETPAYKFTRSEDPFWMAEGRHYLLAETIPFAFDCAVGKWDDCQFDFLVTQTEHHGGDDIWKLVADAKQAAKEAEALALEKWALYLDDWMSDPERLFVHYLIEFHALQMWLGNFELGERVPRLGVELAEQEQERRSDSSLSLGAKLSF